MIKNIILYEMKNLIQYCNQRKNKNCKCSSNKKPFVCFHLNAYDKTYFQAHYFYVKNFIFILKSESQTEVCFFCCVNRSRSPPASDLNLSLKTNLNRRNEYV